MMESAVELDSIQFTISTKKPYKASSTDYKQKWVREILADNIMIDASLKC